MKKQSLPPKASSLSRSMRDIGYSPETAIADIIDNSITACASRVEIWFDFNPDKPYLCIADNGCGMTHSELVDAMRHGSISPENRRTDNDLGRFGLGLKTASFSQCRQLTVVSRKNGNSSGAVWDLDTILDEDKWILGILDDDEMRELPYVDTLENSDGTLVLWSKLDRLLSSDQKNINQNMSYEKIEVVEKHLSLVFHRFLAGEIKHSKLSIFINGHQVEPFDPFCLKNKATQQLQKEIIRMDGHEILIQPYILPHHSKLSPEEHDFYQDRSEFLSNQGGYVYRNKRLMTWGTWFRLIAKGEASKLARVRIDFPSALDEHWTIDIKKSKAEPPHQVKERLRQIIDRIAGQSMKIHSGRGKRLLEKIAEPLWIRYAGHGEIRYELNREHSILRAFRNSIEEGKSNMFLDVLDIIEKSIPVDAIYSDYSSSPKSFERTPDINPEEIKAKLYAMIDILSTENELSEEKLREIFSSLTPFRQYSKEIDEVIREKYYA